METPFDRILVNTMDNDPLKAFAYYCQIDYFLMINFKYS